jgi:cytochrome c-type biogenesis protein CcmH/NrfG
VSLSRIELLRAAVEKDPADARARFFLASELFRAKEWERAAKEFETYLEASPPDPAAARKSLGLCYERVGRTTEAAAAYRRAVDEALACGHSGLADEIRTLLEDVAS